MATPLSPGAVIIGPRPILPEPQSLLSEQAKVPGLDGEKMSKSYGNTIELREAPEVTEEKIRTMQTDPARVRLKDPGNPENCPVFGLHQIYSDEERNRWVIEGCTSAGIGCIDCKKPLIESITSEQQERRERAAQFEEDPGLVHAILLEGSEKARDVAKETIEDVRAAIGLGS